MTNSRKLNKIWTATVFSVVAVLLLAIFAVVLAPVSNTASADAYKVPYDESLDWEQIYEDYIGTTDKDWYLGEDYLDYYNAFNEVQAMLADKSFNKDALKADPIIIAVVDDGIGNIYALDADGKKVAQGATAYFTNPNGLDIKYEIHPIFKDVLLTDENGDYVYKNVTTTYKWYEEQVPIVQNGDIAHDMFSFTNHGTANTGVIAFFIHKFGLEDYVKIVPIKADNYMDAAGVAYAGSQWTQDSVDFAMQVGADVLSLSLTGLKAASAEEVRQKVLVVQSAGNKAEYITDREPAKFDDVICVTNYDRDAYGNVVLYEKLNENGAVTGGSNYGDICDVSAPGEKLVVPTRLGTYGYVGGTSMSTPVVSFASALAMFRYRGYNNYNTGLQMTSKAYKEMVSYTFDKTVTKVAPEGTFTYTALDFDKIVTYNYFSDQTYVERAELTYSNTFTLITNAEDEMQVGDEIGVKAYTTDQSLASCAVEWECYVNGILIESAEGWDFEMVVPKMAGDYVIYAELYDGNTLKVKDSISFRVVEWGRDWQEIYDDFTEDIRDDWYFDEQYLDLYNAIVEVQNMLNDSVFDRDALKKDPIVIAAIETGISSAYIKSTGARAGLTAIFINPVEVEYVLHPIYEDVLLKDENGDYVYYLSSPTFEYQPKKTAQDPDPKHVTYYWHNTGDIAQDMVSVDDHGIGVTGILAYLIHQFGLEDYVKILPIKADSAYVRNENNQIVTRYDMNSLNDAIKFARDAGADVVNASFGGSQDNSLYGSYADSMLVVGAAGNDVGAVQFYPGGFENVLGVMDYSRDEDGNVVIYLNPDDPSDGATYGEWYDVAAPGFDLITPCYGNHISYSTSYKQMHGASAATPVATFAGALALFRYRGYNSYGTGIEITPRIAREMIPYCTDKVATKDVGNGVVYEYPALDFNAVLTYDFLKDGEFMNSVGHHASGYFGVLSNAKDVEEVGNTILLRASLIFDESKYDKLGTITWYYRLDGVEYVIGTGNEICFVIPEEGDYDIYYALAVWKGTANEYKRSAELIEFSVPAENQLSTPEKVVVNSNLKSNYMVDSAATVTLSASIGVDEYTTDTPYWWGVVDGKYTFEIGSGWTVDYVIPGAAGSYQIFCALVDENGVKYAQSTEKLEFAVSNYEPNKIVIYSNAKREYKVDTTDKIMLSAVVSPANSYTDGEFAWFYLSAGNKYHFITTGLTAELQVPQEVGTYRINCGYRNSDGAYYLLASNPIDFTVTNYAPESITLTSNVTGEYRVDKSYVASFNATVNPTNAVFDGTIVWCYELDGNVVEFGDGASVTISIPHVVGRYTVYCVIYDDNDNVILQSNSVAFNVVEIGYDWEEDYQNYLDTYANAHGGADADWYFDEQYLDLYNAIVELQNMLSDPNFDKASLIEDHIVVAVIEPGFSVAYSTDEYGYLVQEVGFGHTIKEKNPNTAFRMHPIFEDVILTDANGNYVYANLATDILYTDMRDGTEIHYTWENTGDMAHDLVSFDDHGVAVGGIIAYLIHQFGIEDYVKIMPIKAGDSFWVDEKGVFQRGFTTEILEEALQWAYANGADVVNASYGIEDSQVYKTLADEILVVGAAGNTNQLELRYPSGYDNVLGVMNYVKDGAGNLVLYNGTAGSTYGEWYDVVAPGEDLVVPCYGTTLDTIYSYKVMGGTSSSAPIATFASILAMIRYRGYDNYGADVELTPNVIKNMIPYCSDQVATKKDGNVTYSYPALDFKNVLTYDFYGDQDFLELIGVSTVLDVTSNAELIHYLGDTISLSATITPNGLFQDEQPYWWYEFDGKANAIGYGWNINFTIPNQIGEYAIYCALSNNESGLYIQSDDAILLTAYAKVNALSVVTDVESEYKVDANAVVILSATIGADEYTTDTPYWWGVVDGKYTFEIGSGWTVDYQIPMDVGSYQIFCALVDENGVKYAQSTEKLEFAVSNYAVESVTIIANVESEYKVNNNLVVVLSASFNPSKAVVDGKLCWYYSDGVVEIEIGYGAMIQFAIPNEVGEYAIYCEYISNDGDRIRSTNEIEFAVTNYAPESISVSGNVANEYKVDTDAVVTLSATINPTLAVTEDTLTWWYELGGVATTIGTGATVNFAIPNVAGEYTIYCALVNANGEETLVSTDTLTFAVVYYTPESISVSGNVESEYKVDANAVVTLNATIGADEYTTDTPYWWGIVDGKYAFEIGSGWTVDYVIPGAAGSYQIFCALLDENGVKYAQSTEKLEFAVSNYAVESVTILADVESEYKVNNNTVVVLSASFNPSKAVVDGNLCWYYSDGVVDVEIGYGAMIQFAIPNEVGEYAIYCEYISNDGNRIRSTNEIEFAVTNYAPESILISIVEHDAVSVKFNATINPTNAVTEDTLVWICKVGTTTTEVGTGATLDFVLPTEPGTYTIYCVLKDAEGNITLSNSNTLSIDVLDYSPKSTTINTILDNEFLIDTTEVVTLTATTNPSNYKTEDALTWWYEVDGKETIIGTGTTVEFAIPNVAGNYVVKCAYVGKDGARYAQSTNVVSFAVVYHTPESISVSGNVANEYKVDTNAVVTLSATINPTLAVTVDTLTWWYEVGGKEAIIGTGATVNFAIPNVVGEYTIYCALVNAKGEETLVSTDTITFAVTNYAPESISISIVEHDAVSVKFNATINPTNAVTEDTLVWICKVGTTTTEVGTGATLDFVLPAEPGTYTIYCVLKDAEGNITLSNSNTLSIDVLDYSPKSTTINTILDNEFLIDTTEVVTLTATTNPSNYKTEDALTWWCEVDGKETIIGTGTTVEFAIPNVAGNYVVKCAYVGKDGARYAQSTNTVSFAVIYYAPEDVDVEVVETFDKAVHYAIPQNLLDPTVVEEIEWYLNGILVATGADYTCTLIMPGEYVITVVVGGVERQVATHTVEDTTPTPPVIEDEPTTPSTDGNETPSVDDKDNGSDAALIATSTILGIATLGFASWAISMTAKKKRKTPADK